jgi:hypothetical protein
MYSFVKTRLFAPIVPISLLLKNKTLLGEEGRLHQWEGRGGREKG